MIRSFTKQSYRPAMSMAKIFPEHMNFDPLMTYAASFHSKPLILKSRSFIDTCTLAVTRTPMLFSCRAVTGIQGSVGRMCARQMTPCIRATQPQRQSPLQVAAPDLLDQHGRARHQEVADLGGARFLAASELSLRSKAARKPLHAEPKRLRH